MDLIPKVKSGLSFNTLHQRANAHIVMPLRAQIQGQDVIAPLFDDEKWAELKQAVKKKDVEVILPCCHNTAFLRVSPLGTKHFVHTDKRSCRWKSESMQKVQIKSEILLACRDSGYEVSTEVVTTDWQTDVLASKGHIKIAFNVQLTRQPMKEMRKRQEQYAQDGIRGCWFVKYLPKELTTPRHALPVFLLSKEEHEKGYRISVERDRWEVYEEKHRFSVSHFVKALLSRKIRFCSFLKSRPTQDITIVFFEMTCWRCQKSSHVFEVESECSAMCGARIPMAHAMWSTEKFCFRPEILQAIRKYLHTPAGNSLSVGTIKRRYSKTVGKTYLSFGCAYCDAILGDWYIQDAYSSTMRDGGGKEVELTVQVDPPVLYEYPHWCYSEKSMFCQ